jgi:outer membrane protein assembly factor BamB
MDMRQQGLKWILPGLLIAVGAVLFSVWIFDYQRFDVAVRLPGADGRPAASAVSIGGGPAAGSLQTFDGKPSVIEGSWPGFRGADYDAISKEKIPLLRQFPEGGPKKLWQMSLGEGYAGPAVWKGRVYVIDYDMAKQADAIRCLSLEDGKEIWRYSYPVKIKRNHGMSRTTPAVADGFVVTMGPKCHVCCLNAETGQFVWGMDLVREYGTQEPLWYAGQCPRIENGRAIIAPGGKALMIAVECATGKIVWQTENPDGWQMTHSSILPMNFAGKRMYVYCASGGVIGVDAENGRIFWKTDQWKLKTNVPTPVDCGDGKIFFSAGYNKGSMMLQLKQAGGEIVPQVLFTLKANVFGADQQTPVFYQGYIYGVRPDKQLVCMDTDGKILWNSGEANTYGLGSYMIADGKIIVLNDEGVLSFIEAKPDVFSLITQAKVLEGHESWGPMALVSGRLIVRDLTNMACVDVSMQ